jgi:hypothetical protein
MSTSSIVVKASPTNLMVNISGIGNPGGQVSVGPYGMSMKDFLEVVSHVLTDTILDPEDPRFQFIEHVRSMRPVESFPKGEQLASTVPFNK